MLNWYADRLGDARRWESIFAIVCRVDQSPPDQLLEELRRLGPEGERAAAMLTAALSTSQSPGTLAGTPRLQRMRLRRLSRTRIHLLSCDATAETDGPAFAGRRCVSSALHTLGAWMSRS